MERAGAIESGRCYRTLEMIGLLTRETGLPRELCEAVLGALIGVVRSSVSSTVEQNTRYREHLEQGRGVVVLDFQAPYYFGSHDDLAIFSEEAGVGYREAERVLWHIMSQFQLLRGEQAFEPLGWIEDAGNAGHVVIRPWSDFLAPKIDWPIELITA